MNRKGFTMIEILAAVTILAIISTMAIIGYSRYTESTRKKAYEVMAKAVNTAAEEYLIDFPSAAVKTRKIPTETGEMYVIDDIDTATSISFSDLIERQYLSSANDPVTRDTSCSGRVIIGKVKSELIGGLDKYIYMIDMCCSKYQARYLYTYEIRDGKTINHEEVDKKIDVCPESNGNEDNNGDANNNNDGLDGKPTYTVTYNLGGGTVSGNNPKRALAYAADNYDVVPFEVNSPKKTGYVFKGWTVHDFRNGTAACSSETFTNPWDATGIGSDTQVCTPGPDGKTYFVKLETEHGSTVTLTAVWEAENVGPFGTVSPYPDNGMGGIQEISLEYTAPKAQSWSIINFAKESIQIPVSKSLDGTLNVKAYISNRIDGTVDYTSISQAIDENNDGYYDYVRFSETINRSDIKKWIFTYGILCDIHNIKYTPIGSLDLKGINLVGSEASIPVYSTNNHFGVFANGEYSNDYTNKATVQDNDNDGYVDYIKFSPSITDKSIKFWKIRYCE